MNISEKGTALIREFEGLRLKAYLDAVGVPTIGFGSTFYEDGSKVKLGDVITKERAEQLLRFHINKTFIPAISPAIKVNLNQNQQDSILSFTYNVGSAGFLKSTLLKKINNNPLDPSIESEFLRWNKAKGKVLSALTKRRQKEADLYFS